MADPTTPTPANMIRLGLNSTLPSLAMTRDPEYAAAVRELEREEAAKATVQPPPPEAVERAIEEVRKEAVFAERYGDSTSYLAARQALLALYQATTRRAEAAEERAIDRLSEANVAKAHLAALKAAWMPVYDACKEGNSDFVRHQPVNAGLGACVLTEIRRLQSAAALKAKGVEGATDRFKEAGGGEESVTASEASTSLTSPATTRGGVRPSDPPATVPPMSDDPNLDATPDAHPAWWRGQFYGVDAVVRTLTEMLDRGALVGAFSHTGMDALARRMLAGTEGMVERCSDGDGDGEYRVVRVPDDWRVGARVRVVPLPEEGDR